MKILKGSTKQLTRITATAGQGVRSSPNHLTRITAMAGQGVRSNPNHLTRRVRSTVRRPVETLAGQCRFYWRRRLRVLAVELLLFLLLLVVLICINLDAGGGR
jgi:hypothetical protein